MGCAPPATRSVVDHTSAHLAVAHGPEDERVGARQVDDLALDVEGAAARRRGGRAAVADRAVVADGPAPLLARDVAVDLALDLEPAVVGLDLELPVGAAAAAAGADHAVVVAAVRAAGSSLPPVRPPLSSPAGSSSPPRRETEPLWADAAGIATSAPTERVRRTAQGRGRVGRGVRDGGHGSSSVGGASLAGPGRCREMSDGASTPSGPNG